MYNLSDYSSTVFVKAGGIDQWVQVRGEQPGKPLLLFLHGAGMTMQPFTRLLRSWERRFTIAYWDRRGVGKTGARNGRTGSDSWTFEMLAEDGIEVAERVCERLDRQKVIIVAHSQGTIVGTAMVRRRPDLFSAYVGTGQVANMPVNESRSYQLALERARASRDKRAIDELELIGPPPYAEVKTWFQKQRWSFATDPEGRVWQRVAPRMLFTDLRLGPLGIYRFVSAFQFMPPKLYQQTIAANAQHLGTCFEVPFYVIQGADDAQTLSQLASEYFDAVEAPRKRISLISGAGHLAVLLHPEQFLEELETCLVEPPG